MENISLPTDDTPPMAVSMETISSAKGHHRIHCETVEVTSLALRALTYWHAGWDIVEVRQKLDVKDVETPYTMPLHLPLLLHDFSWDASTQTLTVNTFKQVSSQDIHLIPFHIPSAVRIKVEFLGFSPKRRMFIECRGDQVVAIILQLNLNRRKEYKEACPNVSRW